jgi:hypothetical protein
VKLATALGALALASCAPAGALPADAAARFDPAAFFLGRSHGDGTLRKLIGGSARISVDSIGRRERDGTLVLDQTIRVGAKPPSTRRWVMRQIGTGRFTGSLTDASGPVSIEVAGARATVRYQMKGGLNVAQQLALQPGGRTVLNRLNVTKFGIRVATLDETIRKLD